MRKMHKLKFTFVNKSCYSIRIIIHLIQITNKRDYPKSVMISFANIG